MKAGIYKITNILNGKFYIGSTNNFYKRKHNHFSKLGLGKHHNSHLQSSWNKYGSENFIFEIISICPEEYLIRLEQWFIDNLKPKYNQLPKAGSSRGRIISEEEKERLRNLRKGVSISDKHREILKRLAIGRVFSSSSRSKISSALKGKPKSEEAKSNMSKAKTGKVGPNKGKKFSEEHKKKLSEAKKKKYKFRIINVYNYV